MDSTKIRLTQRSIEAEVKKLANKWPSDKSRIEIRDETQTGLQIHFTRTGAPTYYLVKFIRGRFKRIRIGTIDEYGPQDARDKASDLLKDLREGKVVASEHPTKAPEGVPTLNTLIEEVSRSVWSKNAQPDEPRKIVHRYMSKKLSWPLTEFNRVGARDFLQKIGDENGHHASNRLRTVLIKAWKEAQIVHDYSDNPWSLTSKFDEKSRTRRLNETELGRVYSVINKWEPRELICDIFLTLLYTGVRKSNVFQMEKEEIDFKTMFWTIPAEKAVKHDTEIKVPIVESLVPILKRNIKEAGSRPWVFKAKKKDDPPVDLYKPWNELLKRSKIKNYHIHDQRRTLASFMTDEGCPESVVDMVLSHGEPRNVTGVYTRPQLKTLREWMEKAIKVMERCK